MKKNKIFPLTFLTLSVLALLSKSIFITSCGNSGGTNGKTPIVEEEKIVLKPAPVFNGDSAYQFVKAQVDFGPRNPNSEGHKKCGDYLINQLKSFGFETISQDFDAIAYDGKILKSRNIIGIFNPKATTRILLAAHWDTRPMNDKEEKDSTKYTPIEGANDGASGVGILLELARTISLAEKKPDVGIDIIFFDSEDYGQPENFQGQYKADAWCLGSQYWSKNKHVPNYSAYYGILVDMAGAANAKFYMEGTSMQVAPIINNKVWNIAQTAGYGKYFISKPAPMITDDHTYVNNIAKIPMIDIIDYEPNSDGYFPDYHHTSKDNMQIIDKNTLKAVGQTLIQVLYNEDAGITQ